MRAEYHAPHSLPLIPDLMPFVLEKEVVRSGVREKHRAVQHSVNHQSVVVDKRGARAAITVRSADGLAETIYTVSVRESAGLAETGVSQAAAGALGVSLAALGIIVEQLKRERL